ncbi:MAG TPA: MFS transporter, partial [Cyanobacteria bacterium UBA9971]|nr:MFS transporter [Cyanobacteria bacterium UBA9971]
MLIGAILGAIALIAMPYAPTLIMAAASLWIIDICVNVSMGPHRALVPDTMPSEQHAL